MDCTDQGSGIRSLSTLLDTFQVRSGLWIPDSNEEIQKFVPKAEERIVPVARRDDDVEWAKLMGSYLHNVLCQFEINRRIKSGELLIRLLQSSVDFVTNSG